MVNSYTDKLDGEIAEEYYQGKREEWMEQQVKILDKIKEYQMVDISYKDTGSKLMELCNSLIIIYDTANNEEKCRILQFVQWNCFWSSNKLYVNLCKPFDILALMNEDNLLRKNENRTKITQNKKWGG